MFQYSLRLNRAREILGKNCIDGYIVKNRENIRYISGFYGEGAGILLTRRKNYLLVNCAYMEEAAGISRFDVRKIVNPVIGEIVSIIKEMNIRAVGYDPLELSCAECSLLKKTCPDRELFPIPDEISKLREIKEPDESRIVRENCRLGEVALSMLMNEIRPGMKEREVKNRLVLHLLEVGMDGQAFEAIVLSGRRTSLPHGDSGDKRIQPGDLILVDYGVRRKGYCTDSTRMFTVGRASSRQKYLYKVVNSALDNAIRHAKPGNRLCDVHRAAESVFEKEGLAKYFQYPVGHGVGLAVHELPSVDNTCQEVIKPGMIFTLEPGIHIPGWGGIRIEEVVLMTHSGPELLTMIERRELQEIQGGKNVKYNGFSQWIEN